MVYSISVDEQGRINGICPDDLSGGSGWLRAETDLTPRTELFDKRGRALYKVSGGSVIARTNEEIAADAPETETADVSDAERLDQIEAGLIELAAIITGGE